MDREPLETGSDLVERRGGPWRAEGWGDASHAFLGASEALLRAELQLWRVGETPPWSRLRFELVADRSADAFAHYAYGWHTIGVHAGLAQQLWHALPKIVNSSVWKERSVELDPPLFRGEIQAMAETVARSALRWVFAHEIAHAFRGHTLFLRELGLKPTLHEATGAEAELEWEIERFFELDADSVASDLLIALDEAVIGAKARRDRESGFAQVIFAVGLVLLLLDRGQADLADYRESGHPHPFVRLLFALDCCSDRAKTELKLSKPRLKACAKSAIQGLALAATVLGYSAPTWTLSAGEYRRALQLLEDDTALWKRQKAALMGQTSSLGHERWFRQ